MVPFSKTFNPAAALKPVVQAVTQNNCVTKIDCGFSVT